MRFKNYDDLLDKILNDKLIVEIYLIDLLQNIWNVSVMNCACVSIVVHTLL